MISGGRMHRTYYSAIERGEQNITLDTLETVCKGLGVRMREVMKEAGD
jgi:transcriptional regulator with XRE-family HTH domain